MSKAQLTQKFQQQKYHSKPSTSKNYIHNVNNSPENAAPTTPLK